MNFRPINRTALFLLLANCLLLASSAGAQVDNGIVVGKPKVFDNRSLYIMLDELRAQLKNVQTVDPQKLATSLGLLQGSQSHDVSVAVNLSGSALPKVTTNEKADSSGKLVPSDRSTEQAAVTPTPPGLPELPTAPTFTPSFGENSQDLLADQVSLSYQIFNIRMLLERSLSDRLLDKDPRLQALLGFSISLDPAKAMRDHAAYVEIRVTPLDRTGDTEAASLVSLMPLEKTYNSAALDTKASAFGGSAVARVVTLGVNVRNRSQNFYLFRDADTIALERLPASTAKSSAVSFGWEFRPVLGRRSVSPGMRQMFAVLALPATDNANTLPQRLQVEVRTYWRRYHRKTLSTKPTIEYDSGWQPLGAALAYNSRDFETKLAPSIEKVRCFPIGSETGVCSIMGKNLFPGTRVLLGNTTFDSASKDLIIKSDNTMEVRVNLRDLATSEALISGRYGTIPDYNPTAITISSGLKIHSLDLCPKGDQVQATIRLQDKDGNDLMLPTDEVPFLSIGDTFWPGPYDLQAFKCEAKQPIASSPPASHTCYRLQVNIPTSLISGPTRVRVRYPFRGPYWSDTWTVSSPRKVTGISNLGGDPDATLAITGTFLKTATVTLDQDTKYPLKVNQAGTLATFKIKKKDLDKYSHVIVEVPNSDPVVLDVPPAPSVGKPAVDPGKKGKSKETKPSTKAKDSGKKA